MRRVAVSERSANVAGMKVFISSVTYALRAERDGLAALLQVVPPYQPLRFEDFKAQDRSSREACLAGVDACDVYVLLLGPRYGEPLPDSAMAPTEEEFEQARRLGKPILAFVKEIDEPDEPRQAQFKARVQSYVNGYFRDAFTDPQSLNLAVLAALKEMSEAAVGLEWTPLHEPAPLVWRWQVPSVQEPALHAPVLDAYLVPLEVPPLRTTQLQALPSLLTRTAREMGLFSDTAAVKADSVADLAWSWVREGNTNTGFFDERQDHQYCGMLMHRAGQVTAFEALPTDSMGALVNASELQHRLVRLIRAATPYVPDGAKAVAVAASLRPLDTLFEGDPAAVGGRRRGTWRNARGAAAVMNPLTAVSTGALLQHTGDIAAEMTAELLDGLRQAQ